MVANNAIIINHDVANKVHVKTLCHCNYITCKPVLRFVPAERLI